MKAKLLIPVVALLAFFMPLTSLASFSDVPKTHSNYVAISYLQEQNIIKGYEDGTFRPDQLVNRVEALKIILGGNGIEVPKDFETPAFLDVKTADWFTPYVMAAKSLGIVNGNPDGTFAPARNVAKAEFLKMLLNTNNFNQEKWQSKAMFPDVPEDAWFNSFMNYGGQAGLIIPDENGNLNPGQNLTRSEVAEILYVMKIILGGSNTQFLISQAEKQMIQIDLYVGENNGNAAKRASELSVDLTQQALKNMPDDNIVLAAAKLAKAYDFLVNAYLSGLEDNFDETKKWAEQAKAKATEAWEVNNDTQPIAKYIKDRADQIVAQIPAS